MAEPSIHLVTANPTVDVHYYVPRWQRGEANRVHRVTRQVGGKGINAARILHRWDYRVSTGGFLGDESATLATEISELAPIFTPVRGRTRNAVIVSSTDGDTVFNEPGPKVNHTDWDALVAATIAQIPSPPTAQSIISLHGSLPPGSDPQAVIDLVHAAHHRGAIVVVDTHGDALVAAAEAGADYLLPNEHEAADVGESWQRGARRLQRTSGAHVLVTLGRAGACWFAPAMPPLLASIAHPLAGHATGAGDALCAALLAAVASTGELTAADMPDLVATGAGAVVCQQVGVIDEQVRARVRNDVEICVLPAN